ncbi:MAG: tetratricopeptide repeat protein [Microcoleus sp.]
MTTNSFRNANKLKQEGRLEEAISFYQTAIEENPEFYWSHYNLGDVFVQLGQWDLAAPCYSRSIELNPNSAWSHHQLGDVLAKLGHWEQAINLYRRAIELSPNFYGFYKSLGNCFDRLGNNVDIDTFESSRFWTEMIPHSENGKSQVIVFDISDDEFLKKTRNLNDEDFLEKSYLTYLQRQADEEGKIFYTKLLGNSMTREEFIAGLRGSLEFKSLLKFSIVSFCLQQSILAYHHAKKLGDNSNKCNQALETALSQLAQALMQQGHLDQAIEIYEQTINISHNLADAYYNQASALSQKGQLKEAMDLYHKAIAINPGKIDIYRDLGAVLVQLNLPDKAVECFKQGIALAKTESDRIELEFKVASVLTGQGHLDTAILHVEAAMGLSNFPNSNKNQPQILIEV